MPYMRNKRDGTLVEVDQAGNPVSRNAGPPMKPTFGLEAPKMQADIGNTQAGTGRTIVDTRKTEQDIQHSATLFESQRREAEAKAHIAQLQAQAAEAEARSKDPFNPQNIEGIETDAMSKLRTIDRIRRNATRGPLPALGLGAETLAGVGGTNARNVRADIGSLQAGGALSQVMKMSQETGKNPLSPMSRSDVDLVANNTANLDQGQDPENFEANLGQYQQAYTRAYGGAVGARTLNKEVERLAKTLPPEQRDQYRALAARFYNDRITQPGALNRPRRTLGNAPRKSRVIDFNDWNK